MAETQHMIGLLGGGQLGTFFCIAAKQMGFRVSVWDPDPDAPAHAWADQSTIAPFDDAQAATRFIAKTTVVTYEWENVPLSLLERIEAHRAIHPGRNILKHLQNRISEKTFLAKQGFPIASYKIFFEVSEVNAAVQSLGYPVICKTATEGYDGIGQTRLNNKNGLLAFMAEFQTHKDGWVAEKVIDFTKELSVLVARNIEGICLSYPVSENEHESGILRRSTLPARCGEEVQNRAQRLCESVITSLQGVGLFCIELFQQSDGSLLINEVAPRPHNSGHYTLDATDCSQFEMQVRAVCGLPLSKPRLHSQACMLNVLGTEINALRLPELRHKLLSLSGIHLYDYRKLTLSPRRKMGHITLTNLTTSSMKNQIKTVQDVLAEAAIYGI